MSVYVSEGQVLSALLRFLHESVERELTAVKRGLDQNAYMRGCGSIHAYERTIDEARDLIKKANGGLIDEEENA